MVTPTRHIGLALNLTTQSLVAAMPRRRGQELARLTLSAKKNGTYLVLEADGTFEPPLQEVRELFELRFVQRRDDAPLPDDLSADLRLAVSTVRYTQSNSVVLVRDGATLGVGAGQQPRVDCIHLAGAKARRSTTVRRQHHRSGEIRRELHRRAGRLDPLGTGHRRSRRTRHQPDPHRAAVVPPLRGLAVSAIPVRRTVIGTSALNSAIE